MTKETLSPERKARLESVNGWAWNALDEKWEAGFVFLTEFASREGHCLVPQKFQTTDGFSLGAWISSQRAAQETMPIEQKMRLEAIPGWVWDVRAAQWDIGFGHLVEFVEREGHCQVNLNHQTSDGFRLGQWVSTQRRNQNSLPIERKNQLDQFPGWKWGKMSFPRKLDCQG
jgi:hypothetical protein